MKRFYLNYHVSNNGDGSATPRFHTSKADAKQAERVALEEFGEGWGESCVGYVTLRIHGDNIQFLVREFTMYDDGKTGYFTDIWHNLSTQEEDHG